LEEIVKKQNEGGCKEDTDALLDEEAYIQAMDFFCRQPAKESNRQC
jgi:hypothetical protein